MSGTDFGYAATRQAAKKGDVTRSAILSAYALPTRCPVLTQRILISAYALPTVLYAVSGSYTTAVPASHLCSYAPDTRTDLPYAGRTDLPYAGRTDLPYAGRTDLLYAGRMILGETVEVHDYDHRYPLHLASADARCATPLRD
eukprot:2005489-Rhodomonas_salina.7